MAVRFCSLIFLAVLISACSSGSGGGNSNDTTNNNRYYINASSGDDQNSGQSPESPWRTFDNIDSHAFNAGDTIYLNRGDTWYESITLPRSNLTVTAYGTGNLPHIKGSTINTATWSLLNSNIYFISAIVHTDGGLGNLSSNGNLLSFVEWNTDASTTLSSAANGSYTYDNTNNLLYVKTTTDPNTAEYEYSTIYRGILSDSLDNITISNIKVSRFSLHGIEFRNCNDCAATNVEVSDIGGALIGTVYAGNGIEFGNNINNGSVSSSTITDIFDSCLSPQSYQSNLTLSNIEFENNTLSRCGFAGIEITILDIGGSSNSEISNITITDSSISESGKGWSGQRYGTEGNGILINADVGAGDISTVLVNSTSIDSSAGNGILIRGNAQNIDITASALFDNDDVGIQIADTSMQGPEVNIETSIIHGNLDYGVSLNCIACDQFSLRQNTFFDNTTINAAILNQADTVLIENNLFFSSSPMTDIFVATPLVNSTVDYNCYSNKTNMFGYGGAAYSTVSDFNTATGLESNGTHTNDIGFINASLANFNLTNTSGCIASGNNIGILTDYAGNSYNTPPAAGAFEAN